jgi:hypothetical protein
MATCAAWVRSHFVRDTWKWTSTHWTPPETWSGPNWGATRDTTIHEIGWTGGTICIWRDTVHATGQDAETFLVDWTGAYREGTYFDHIRMAPAWNDAVVPGYGAGNWHRFYVRVATIRNYRLGGNGLPHYTVAAAAPAWALALLLAILPARWVIQ